MNTTILWHDCKILGPERCPLTSLESGFQLSGTVLCPVEGAPLMRCQRGWKEPLLILR
jgi:hypothetical protein